MPWVSSKATGSQPGLRGTAMKSALGSSLDAAEGGELLGVLLALSGPGHPSLGAHWGHSLGSHVVHLVVIATSMSFLEPQGCVPCTRGQWPSHLLHFASLPLASSLAGLLALSPCPLPGAASLAHSLPTLSSLHLLFPVLRMPFLFLAWLLLRHFPSPKAAVPLQCAPLTAVNTQATSLLHCAWHPLRASCHCVSLAPHLPVSSESRLHTGRAWVWLACHRLPQHTAGKNSCLTRASSRLKVWYTQQ